MRDKESSIPLVLDRECRECCGSGEYDGVACGECDGRGRKLTDFGEAMLDFFERWLGVGVAQSGGYRLVRKDKVT